MKRAPKCEWFDDESFWELASQGMFSPRSFLQAETIAERMIQLVEPSGKDVLDLCCGPGRYAIPLAKLGFRVTGVDRTARYLSQARSRARRSGVRVSFVKKDMRAFVRSGAFDLAINMYNSFGYFENRDDDLLVLKNINQSLRPGGMVVIDNAGKEVVAHSYKDVFATDMPDGTVCVHRLKIIDDWTRVRQEWYYIRGDTVESISFKLNLYSGQEMREIMERAGFVDVKQYGDFKGAPYDMEARRQITIARKPE